MSEVTFSPKMMESLHFLSKNIVDGENLAKAVPTVNSLGDPITEVKSLATAMGVSEKIAAAYALESDNAELKADAVEVLAPGVYNAFEDAYEAIVHHAYDIAAKSEIVELKRVRMVRSSSGVRRFGQKLGSIIVTDGQAPLDGLQVVHGDVPGYDKVADKKGNAYYIGWEGNKWVVRSGQSKAIVFESSNRSSGQVDALKWLNGRVGGSQSPAKKSDETEVEIKVQRTNSAVERLGKQGHALRNANGDYSYPIANVADLKNAIQAFGRSSEADRQKLKAFIKRRARALKRPDLIPDDWKTGEPEGVEEKDWNIEPGRNWVENTRPGLPRYIERIAKAIFRGGKHTRSQAIAIAVSRVKRWATGVGVNTDTQAKAAKAVAEWEALKAKNKARMAAKKKG